ncbi:MAG: polysaccharide biosynthesis C-terminal domain-containing protein [Chloroflexi bacterium]|nr:polysaccharide biosynthesis C-terminal domain-containing protein [Chloroflexota bacterium]
MMLGVPIGLGLIVIANGLVVLLLFGAEFANSGLVLAVFGLVLILTYQNMLLGQFLVSTDRQNRWTAVMVVATIATIPLDLLLIPWCVARFGNGALGGAIAFVVTEAGMMLAGLWLLPAGALTRRNAAQAVRVLLAGLIMLAVTWPCTTFSCCRCWWARPRTPWLSGYSAHFPPKTWRCLRTSGRRCGGVRRVGE